MATYDLYLLESFQLVIAGHTFSGFRSDKMRALLAYLVVEGKGRPIRREALARFLWPDFTEQSARHNLRTTLYELRKLFPAEGLLSVNRKDVLFNLDDQEAFWCDATLLDTTLEALFSHCINQDIAQRRLAALRCCRAPGDFMEGFTLADNPGFMTWLERQREHYRRQIVLARRELTSRATATKVNGLPHSLGSLLVKDAINLARVLGDSSPQAGSDFRLDSIGRRRGDLDSSPDAALLARLPAKHEESSHFEIAAVSAIATLLRALGRRQQSLAYHEEALALAKLQGIDCVESYVTASFANLWTDLGDLEKARFYHLQALAIHESGDHPIDIAESLGGLGDIHLALGDLAEAEKYYLQVRRILQDLHQPAFVATALIGLAVIRLWQGDAELALRQCQEALCMARGHNASRVEANGLFVLGQILAETDQQDEATLRYLQTLLLSGHHAAPYLAARAGLAGISLAQGDPAHALNTIEEILPQLEELPFAVTPESFRVHLVCYQVLAAAGDPRALKVLAGANSLLEAYSAKLADAAARRGFLEVVPSHRALRQAARAAGLDAS